MPAEAYLQLSAVLFTIGLVGVTLRRNFLAVLIGLELMLNAANLVLIAASRAWGNAQGQVLFLAVVSVAAAEAGVGLAIALRLFRFTGGVDRDRLSDLKS